jgi:hypothetical protein
MDNRPLETSFDSTRNRLAYFSFDGATAGVSASRDISMGEELLLCYGPQQGRHSRDERAAMLRDQYAFECHCGACTGRCVALVCGVWESGERGRLKKRLDKQSQFTMCDVALATRLYCIK